MVLGHQFLNGMELDLGSDVILAIAVVDLEVYNTTTVTGVGVCVGGWVGGWVCGCGCVCVMCRQ